MIMAVRIAKLPSYHHCIPSDKQKQPRLFPECNQVKAGAVLSVSVHCRGVSYAMAIPHNSKCRYGERGAAAAKPKAQIILDAAKVSAASGGNSEPKQGQRSQSARGFCPRSTMRVPQPDIIEHFGNADAVPQPPKRCLSRKAGIVRCCPMVIRSQGKPCALRCYWQARWLRPPS